MVGAGEQKRAAFAAAGVPVTDAYTITLKTT
jgi:hypothetical protein